MALPKINHLWAVRRLTFFRIVFLIPVLLLVTWVAATAQLAGKGQINGTVTDTSGAAIPGAEVVVKSKQTSLSTNTTTTSSGDFSLPTLDPGDYTVMITANGFQKLVQENVHVNALETQTLNPKLTVGATSEEVTVSAAPPQLETTNATLGATMEQEMYSALPIEMGAYGQPDQRRATDFAFLMPGVQANNTNGNATTNAGIVNGSGSRGAVTAIYIDGVVFVRGGGNGDPRYVWTAISVDAVNQFQVQTNGYSAMYEGQGVQNYTVKQGGNKYHGSVYEFFRNTALDTWGFFPVTNPTTGKLQKPIEHSNEYGINLSGPLVPFGSWKDKLFFFGNYNGFRFTNETPTQMTFPNAAQQAGNFQGVLNSNTGSELASPTGIGIYDPFSQTACTANSTNGPCRYRFGYVYAGTPGKAGNPILGPGGTSAVDVIPASAFSPIAANMQKNLPALNNQNITNNYISPNRNGLTNWSTTERVDWTITPKDTLTLTAAIGRQASSFPAGQTTVGRNIGPIPYNQGQVFAPKTAVAIAEETHIFTPHVINQIKYGFARYNGPTINADYNPAYGAGTAMGITNLPAGQASGAFPITTFASGANPPTNWAGTTASVTIAQNFTLVDNVQWIFGNHSLTLGGQIAWIQYLNRPATTGTTPLTLTNSVNPTAQINSNGQPNTFTVTANTGLAYASFLLGQIGSSSMTSYAVQEYASRFSAVSPYVQDNWKVNSRLTLDLGLRWDYFPPVRENVDNLSFFNPNLTNPVTGSGGVLQFAGNGTNTCNCSSPSNTYWKNFGPRFGFAYQSDPKTVWRGSMGVMFTHGNGVGGGGASSLGGGNVSLGFSSSASTGLNGDSTAALIFNKGNTAYPTIPAAPGRSALPQTGTGNTTVSGYTTSSPLNIAYFDPYFGSRAPEYINWSFGFQHQWTNAFTSTISYVGSQGHFLVADGSNLRGYWANQLDPKYLQYGASLGQSGASIATFCNAHSGVCPANWPLFNTGQQLNVLLRPFPFNNPSDIVNGFANANYHALQTSFNMRPSHGLTFMANYTWSRSIDDGGTFRTGYAIPAGLVAGTTQGYAADRIERGVSTSNQPQHVVVTGVWDMPFGRSIANSHEWQRALLGGYKFSTIYQAFSGSPLAITASSCQTNQAQSTCVPNLNPNFPANGSARVNGKWGQGITAKATNAISYIAASGGSATAPTGPFISTSLVATSPFTPSFTFANSPRTAPYNLYGPGNYNLDVALVRSFPLHFTEAAKLDLRAEWYNITNHTWFAVASSQLGNANFGTVTSNPSATRKSAQLSARIEF
ncbi:MAG TPA: carboxypeptidase-like regulatory domain-containing protein [Acidobacteriaceae bacterium]|nr:carboxypeptidase-like regulatory domain-containing protein [Acidobacteriaceae bacterium]